MQLLLDINVKVKEKTELSKYIWEFKTSTINYDLKSFKACKAHPCTGGSRKRALYLTEKQAILIADPESLVNTRDKLVSKCRHMNKFTLRFFKKR